MEGTRSFLLVPILCFSIHVPHAGGQGIGPSETHGTVNVLLANKNGFALVTDSDLTDSSGHFAGEGPKLFVLDEHTVCSIADFYSDSGPKINGKFPIQTTAPGIVKSLLANLKKDGSVSLKLSELTNLYAFALSRLADIDALGQPNRTPSGAELTVAGYEGDRLHVAWATLKPKRDQGLWSFEIIRSGDSYVGSTVLTRFAGITDVAESILSEKTNRSLAKDPILSYFNEQLALDQGQNLSLDDLRQAAVQIKVRTSSAHFPAVGGKTQYVTMSGGVIRGQDTLSADSDDMCAKSAVQASNIIVGGNVVFSGGYANGCGLSGYFVGFTRLGGIEDLDGKAFIHSAFQGTTLIYNGSGPVFFDPNNRLSDVVLQVSATVPEADEFLAQFRKSFPSVPIRRLSQ